MSCSGVAALASFALTSVLVGCATKLDFDAVSAARERNPFDGGVSGEGGVNELRPGSDGASDASSPSSVLASADAEAAVQADAGAMATFACADLVPAAQFCDDFEALNLASRWDPVDVYPVSFGLIDIDQTSARSGEGSLVAELYEGIDACDNCIHAEVHHELAAISAATQLSAEFDLKVEVIDPGLSRRVGLFQVGFGDDQLLSLEVASTGMHLTANFVEYDLPANATVAARFDHEAFALPAVDRWVHVRFVLDVSAAGGSDDSATVAIDDATLFSGRLHNALRAGAPFVELGLPWLDQSQLSSEAPNQSWRARFDNFVLRTEAP
ncbi:MAG: hypothetical protein JWN04_6700 [Myxococcaceae bacterium]|nr:hypothetical protein [Myxococcaceae bacterium]